MEESKVDTSPNYTGFRLPVSLDGNEIVDQNGMILARTCHDTDEGRDHLKLIVNAINQHEPMKCELSGALAKIHYVKELVSN